MQGIWGLICQKGTVGKVVQTSVKAVGAASRVGLLVSSVSSWQAWQQQSAWRSLRWDEEKRRRCGRVQLGVPATETNWTNALSLLMLPRWSSGTNNCNFISSLHISHTFLFRQSLPLIPTRNSGKDWGQWEKGNDRGWDGWMASLTQWTWVLVDSRSWWWTGMQRNR